MAFSTDELLAFVAVVDGGSITAAAERLGQTVSGVSRALGRLEHKLDATLLQRTTRRLRLTEDGALFLSEARQILQAMDQAEERIALRKHRPAGRLRVDAASPFMLHCVVPYLCEFQRTYPEIRLELSSNERNIDLLEQHADLAIRIGTLADSTLHARTLGSSALHLVASPAYLAEHGEPAAAADLSRHGLLGFTDPESLNDWPLPHAGGERLKIAPTLAASSGETLRQLAVAGAGIACLSYFLIGADLRAGRLRPVLAHAQGDYRQPIHAVYYRNTSLAARINGFLDFMAHRWTF